jgi:hypothetical protein
MKEFFPSPWNMENTLVFAVHVVLSPDAPRIPVLKVD